MKCLICIILNSLLSLSLPHLHTHTDLVLEPLLREIKEQANLLRYRVRLEGRNNSKTWAVLKEKESRGQMWVSGAGAG